MYFVRDTEFWVGTDGLLKSGRTQTELLLLNIQVGRLQVVPTLQNTALNI